MAVGCTLVSFRVSTSYGQDVDLKIFSYDNNDWTNQKKREKRLDALWRWKRTLLFSDSGFSPRSRIPVRRSNGRFSADDLVLWYNDDSLGRNGTWPNSVKRPKSGKMQISYYGEWGQSRFLLLRMDHSLGEEDFHLWWNKRQKGCEIKDATTLHTSSSRAPASFVPPADLCRKRSFIFIYCLYFNLLMRAGPY